jgi:hypothetical protein
LSPSRRFLLSIFGGSPERSQSERTGRRDRRPTKFYELRDNLFEVDGATDCDYRQRTTKVYEHRAGVVRWLKQRFADHDRLTLAWIADENPAQPVGVVGVKYARRTSDTLRRLGYPRGIVPQALQKLPLRVEGGGARFAFFALASRRALTPNPECALVSARP